MSGESVIRTARLVKRYGRLTAVDHVDLDVREGDLFGFLGPNGSGKTTTIRMLLGLVFATSGEIELLGEPVPRRVDHALPRVGTLVEGPAFYPHLTGRRNLATFDAAGPRRPYASRRSRRRRIGAALERVGLADVGRRSVGAYSLGMRQRLGLAAALLRRPRLLVLDEPTNGLDPQGIHEVRTLFAELVAEGTTIFLSSHLLAEVELMCTRAAMMANGRLVAQDSVATLLAPTGRVRVSTPDTLLAREVVGSLSGPRVDERAGGDRPADLVVHLDGLPPERLNHELVSRGVRVQELVIERPTLEQVFLAMTGDGLDRHEHPVATSVGGDAAR
jgi:ABC-2 type transport system ATP-binding protein